MFSIYRFTTKQCMTLSHAMLTVMNGGPLSLAETLLITSDTVCAGTNCVLHV